MIAEYKNLRSIIGYALLLGGTVAFLISPWVASASVFSSQLGAEIFPYSGVSGSGPAATGYATTTVFSAPVSGTHFTDVQVIASPISGATSTNISVLCGSGVSFTIITSWDFDLSTLDPSSLYLLTGSIDGVKQIDGPVNVGNTDCYIQMLTGSAVLGSQPLPKNVNTAGIQVTATPSLSSKPYYKLYVGDTAPIPPIQTLVTNVSTGYATSSVSTLCMSNFATSSSWLDVTGVAVTNGFCRLSVFLFVPDQGTLNLYSNLGPVLQSKIPFSYVYGIQQIFSGLTASSTANLSTVIFSLPSIGSTTPIGSLLPSTLTVLSTSTIGTYLPDSIRQGFLALQRLALWLGLLLLFYRRVVPTHIVKT